MIRYCVFVLALVVSGCASHNPNVVTPAGKAAEKALAVSIRVGELQDAAIAANATSGITDAQAVSVVRFTVAAQKTLKATPAGWEATLKAAWQAAKDAMNQDTKIRLAASLSLVDILIGAL